MTLLRHTTPHGTSQQQVEQPPQELTHDSTTLAEGQHAVQLPYSLQGKVMAFRWYFLVPEVIVMYVQQLFSSHCPEVVRLLQCSGRQLLLQGAGSHVQ